MHMVMEGKYVWARVRQCVCVYVCVCVRACVRAVSAYCALARYILPALIQSLRAYYG